jgi:hypothetical protein
MRMLAIMVIGLLLLAAPPVEAQGNRAVTGDGDGGVSIGGGPDCSSWDAGPGYRYEMCNRSTLGGITRWSCCLKPVTSGGPNWNDPNLRGDVTTPGTHQWSGNR